jgi:hypothetical protein
VRRNVGQTERKRIVGSREKADLLACAGTEASVHRWNRNVDFRYLKAILMILGIALLSELASPQPLTSDQIRLSTLSSPVRPVLSRIGSSKFEEEAHWHLDEMLPRPEIL